MNYFFSIVASLYFLLAVAVVLAAFDRNTLMLPLGIALPMGAIGGTLAAFYRLRDHAESISRMKALAPFLLTQPMIGSVAAFIVYVIFESKIIAIPSIDADSWQTFATLGFLAGFSEAFFLGVTKRAAGVVLDEGRPPAKSDSSNAGESSVELSMS